MLLTVRLRYFPQMPSSGGNTSVIKSLIFNSLVVEIERKIYFAGSNAIQVRLRDFLSLPGKIQYGKTQHGNKNGIRDAFSLADIFSHFHPLSCRRSAWSFSDHHRIVLRAQAYN